MEQMTVTCWQRFFARNWPLKLWLTGGALGGGAWVVRASEFAGDLEGVRTWLWLSAAVLIGMCAGFFVAVATAFLLGPVYSLREKMNGGPFAVGDLVRVIAGTHRGRVGRVYSSWQGDTVRVDLGPEAASDFADVFAGIELVRWSAANKDEQTVQPESQRGGFVPRIVNKPSAPER